MPVRRRRGHEEERQRVHELPILVVEFGAAQTLDQPIGQCRRTEMLLQFAIALVKHRHGMPPAGLEHAEAYASSSGTTIRTASFDRVGDSVCKATTRGTDDEVAGVGGDVFGLWRMRGHGTGVVALA